MSCRQPLVAAASSRRTAAMTGSRIDFGYRSRHEPLEKAPGVVAIEELVGGTDAEEEAVVRGQREARHREQWMMRHGKTIEHARAEQGGERSAHTRGIAS